MSARITIQSGIAAGTSHRINSRVARVGSDPQSDVCLPSADIPAHALTLEFRETHQPQGLQCLVYNRCRSQIYVGAQVVEPDHSIHWSETDILQMEQGIELLLDFDDADDLDSAEAFLEDENEEDAGDDGFDHSSMADPALALERESSQKNSNTTKTIVQLCVTVLCFVGCALLLMRDQNRKTNPDTVVEFAEVVSLGLDDQSVPRSLINRIQYAEAQWVRGRTKVAEEQFRYIRDDLVSENLDPTSPQSKMLKFVQTRLAEGS